jgi:uncharacterized protein (DUF433 family)/predicted nuclease of predicted toxin-antitoxin system
MESLINRIKTNPEICNGKPIIRGLRITVSSILDIMAAGESINNILDAYPILEEKDILACLEYASKVADKTILSYVLKAGWKLYFPGWCKPTQKIRFFHQENFIHVVDIDPTLTDRNIWNLAIKENYVILTRDTDSYDLFLVNDKHPKIIYFRIGNCTLADLHQYFTDYWELILETLSSASFIIAEKNKISAIYWIRCAQAKYMEEGIHRAGRKLY